MFHNKFLWAKDGGFRESKDVFQLHPLGDRLAGFHRRFEFDLARGEDGIFSETVGKPSHDSDAVNLSVRKSQELENHDSLNADTSSIASVFRLSSLGDLRFDINFLDRENRHPWWIEEMRERAVVSTAIVLILIGSH
jgi:hypothetical protein